MLRTTASQSAYEMKQLKRQYSDLQKKHRQDLESYSKIKDENLKLYSQLSDANVDLKRLKFENGQMKDDGFVSYHTYEAV